MLAVTEAVSGLGVMMMDINLNSALAIASADIMRSRVAGVFGTINYGARPLGGVLGGVLGLRVTLMIAAADGTLGCLWLVASPMRRFRTRQDLDSFVRAV